MFVRPARIFFCLLILTASLAQAAVDPKLASELDAFVAARFKTDEPGVAVLVVKDGETILRKGYGLAEVELGVPIKPAMVFRIGSVTKQFTAAAILQLVEQGKISLDDDVTKYLPDFPTHGHPITIERLLSHTSGIANNTDQPGWMSSIRTDQTPAQLIASFKDLPPDFAPGEKWSYTNSAYLLLGAIIEKVSGEPYAAYIQKHLFDPLGLKETGYDDPDAIIPGRVVGYGYTGKGYVNNQYLSMTQPYSAGALLSTVDDLRRWSEAFLGGKVVSPALVQRALTPVKLVSGTATGYGYGWGISNYEGHRIIEHGGGIFGFNAYELVMPDDHLFVAVLSNVAGKQPGTGYVARSLAAMTIGKPRNPKGVMLSPAEAGELAAIYRADSKRALTISSEGGKLYAHETGGPRNLLTPLSPNEFALPDSFNRLRAVRDSAGKVTAIESDAAYEGVVRFARTDEKPAVHVDPKGVKLEPAQLDRLAGVFSLGPSFDFTVARTNDKLFGQATGQPAFELIPTSETEFVPQGVDARITFTLAEGKATMLVLHQNGHDTEGKRKADGPAPQQTVAVDPKVLDQLAGRYALTPAFIITVTHEGNELFAQATGQPKLQIFAKSDSEWFYKAVDAQITFERDATGKVTRLVLHQNGQNIPGERMP
jgi:D-alanyl-D-alanine carboxypeptidase